MTTSERLMLRLTLAMTCFIAAFLLFNTDFNNPESVVNNNYVPSCSEDEIIVGTGDYSGGFWTDYKCGHGDW